MKKMFKVLSIVFVVAIVLTDVFAVSVPNQAEIADNSHKLGTVDTLATNIWATVVIIVQILAVAAVVFAGLRYMFASADQKADIKKSMGILAVGAILVFAATTVIQFVVGATQGALNITNTTNTEVQDED